MEQDRTGARTDPVTAAMVAHDRRRFLPARQRGHAADDRALPIGHGATNSQPSTVHAMITLLDPRPGQRVLDVGSGSGWTVAILGELVGPDGDVLGVELVGALVARAREALAAGEQPWVSVAVAAPGRLGAPERGPWDRILVSADGGRVPVELTDQLAVGGRLVLPVDGRLTVVERTQDGLTERQVRGRWQFVPLR